MIVRCGFDNCSYNVNGLCHSIVVGIGYKNYSYPQMPCSQFTLQEVFINESDSEETTDGDDK